MSGRFLGLLLVIVYAITDANSREKLRYETKLEENALVAGFAITYTMVNEAVSPTFTDTISDMVQVNGSNPKLIDVMNAIVAKHCVYRFTFTVDPRYGVFITGMNGQSEIPTHRLYWLVMRRERKTTLCYLPKGVSTYEPARGESIQWELMQWNSSIPICK